MFFLEIRHIQPFTDLFFFLPYIQLNSGKHLGQYERYSPVCLSGVQFVLLFIHFSVCLSVCLPRMEIM